ncbi:hypothetical protein L1785_11860 [Antribacter sp. KLBMP9083]|uniref:AMIN-like domain-containing protein n=1 Tax=Antribacter soli TaxID=2910976 RepID=A0AA41QGC3_9MICO|nr:hypothetical protein [Antribacter soli]MCF4121677.1 hypothetical protein [Antribacter soli]
MSISRTRATTLGILTAAVLALTGCTDGDDDATPTTGGTTTAATPTPSDTTTTASPSPIATDDGTDADDDAAAPPFPADTSTDTSEPSGTALLTVTDVRTGRHEGYDRVVFELGGTGEGVPGWRVEYVPEALDDGSGNAVEVDGDSILQVVISGTAMPLDSGVTEWPGDRLAPTDTEAVKEVVYRFVFEGYSTAFIGVDGDPRPFRAFLLEDPVRVVVDVRD